MFFIHNASIFLYLQTTFFSLVFLAGCLFSNYSLRFIMGSIHLALTFNVSILLKKKFKTLPSELRNFCSDFHSKAQLITLDTNTEVYKTCTHAHIYMHVQRLYYVCSRKVGYFTPCQVFYAFSFNSSKLNINHILYDTQRSCKKSSESPFFRNVFLSALSPLSAGCNVWEISILTLY